MFWVFLRVRGEERGPRGKEKGGMEGGKKDERGGREISQEIGSVKRWK